MRHVSSWQYPFDLTENMSIREPPSGDRFTDGGYLWESCPCIDCKQKVSKNAET